MKLKTKILPWHEFKTLRDELLGYNQQDEDKVDKTLYLATYHKLLKLHEQGFPLLLQEGEAFEFDSPPVNAYLLPPLDQNPQTPRWLLVFFVTEDEKSWVQLLTWQTDTNRSIIQALANQPRQAIESCNHRLDQRPINLQFVPAPNASTIHLIFTQGELTLVASPSKGIIVTAWNEQTRSEPWIERYSTGAMEPAVKISRYSEDHKKQWQDDVVKDIDGREFAPNNAKMGRIRGADSILNKPEKNWVYLASNRGYVYRLDKNSPDEKPKQSETLYDEVLDVLVLPWPDKEAVLLATVRNSGVVYLLGDDSDKISILHWQHTGKHIWRLVGRGDEHILAIDERQTLLPLRLNAPDEIKAIHKLATQRLVQLYQEELNHYLSNSLDFKHHEPTQFCELGNLALEYFLLGLPLTQAWPLFENWCNKLNGCYKTLNSSQQRTLMDLHYQLINRVFNWLQSCCYKKNPALSDETKELVFTVLLKLLALDNAAPDTLWILLFRKLDWLTRWAEKLTLPDRYLAQIKPIKEHLKYMRADFACGLNLIRPLNTISSYRLNSQVTHIDDANDGQYAFIESNRDLHLYQSNTLGTDCEKKLFIKHGKYWQGQVQFVRTLASKPNEAKRFLIGTLRGELCVLRWDRISADNITVEKTKDCLFAVISSLRLDKYNGYLLLGGRNFKGHACLYGLPASADMAELRLLWTDTKPGILSVLRTNQEENRLWAINRDNGELLNWNISPHYLTTPRFVSNQPHYWLNTVQKLHALQYSATQDLLVCGGDGGLSYALDANTGALRWVVNCVGNLRHIAYLAGENSNSDVWLLCTDERSSLIVNNDGCVTGVLENAGPVSALKVLSQHLLLATMDGRVLVMGNTDKASPIEFNPPPMSGWGAYPVRGGGNIRSATDLCAVLAFESEYTNESLIKIMALCLFAEFLENNNEITDKAENTFHQFWGQQNLHKKIVFLYRLRNLWLNPKTPPNPTICGFSLRLIRTCWDNLLQNTPELNSPTHDEANLLCKLVSPLLDILDKLIHYRYETDTAKQLQSAITQRIWNTAHSDLSPHEIRVFSAIRLNKVLSVWQQLPTTHSDAQRLFAWCNQVATLAQITETEPLRLLLKQLFQAHLRVLAIDNPWQAWLNGLVSGTEPSPVPKPLTEPSPVPKPLNALALANEQLIVSNQDWELLTDIFGDNTSWQA
ncbi:MAG: PQQ-like beta-propeller repeat protein, partial [Methylococcaceae bacterium]|nr:PQQ-like beta-propeller repeat protein [Methylococcaceae bacterium]